jgi:hypothetical protein
MPVSLPAVLDTPRASTAQLPTPTAYDYKGALAAAGYDAPFFEPGSQQYEVGSVMPSLCVFATVF